MHIPQKAFVNLQVASYSTCPGNLRRQWYKQQMATTNKQYYTITY
jgi:hypothetical protein